MSMIRTRPERVTKALLIDWKACGSSVEEFDELFPKGCAVTFKNALKCVHTGLDIGWLLHCVITRAQRNVYVRAWWATEEKYRERRTKLRERTKNWKSEARVRNLLDAEIEKWRRAEVALFMRAWRGTLFEKKGGKDGKA